MRKLARWEYLQGNREKDGEKKRERERERERKKGEEKKFGNKLCVKVQGR